MSRFRRLIFGDFEYGSPPGDLPKPLAFCAYVLEGDFKRVRVIHQWRDEFGSRPPFDTSSDTLFISYSAWAEMLCFKVLCWPFPAHIFDQHTAYLAASNRLLPRARDEERVREPKNFEAACRAYGLDDGWQGMNKDIISKAIGDDTWREKGISPQDIRTYVEEDVRMSVQLFQAQLKGYSTDWLPPVNVERIIHWSEYSAKAVALIQARGMNIDVPLWQLAQENKQTVVRYLLERFDPSHSTAEPIYNEEGEASYARTERWLEAEGIDWPRHDSGELNLKGDTFR
jgi:hypothetical protein